MPDRFRKRSRDSSDEPKSNEAALADCLQKERVDFIRSQSIAKLSIAASESSEMTYGNLLRKVSKVAKCLINRHVKLAGSGRTGRERGIGRVLCRQYGRGEGCADDGPQGC